MLLSGFNIHSCIKLSKLSPTDQALDGDEPPEYAVDRLKVRPNRAEQFTPTHLEQNQLRRDRPLVGR